MNFPALAKKTYDELKEVPRYKGLLYRIFALFKVLTTPKERVEMVHQQVVQSLATLFEDPLVSKYVSCKKGCSFCCHGQVSVTEDEADVLADKIIEDEASIDIRRLGIQSKAKNKAVDWYKISFQDRRCVFLDEAGQCSIYKDRPSVCRTNFVVNNPQDCSTEDGIEKPLRMLKTHDADMIVMAHFIYNKVNGSLPYMLVQSLHNKLSKKSPKKDIDP